MDGARRFGGNVTRDATRKGELRKQPLHALLVLRDVWIHLTVGAFEVSVGDDARSPMPRTRDEQDVEVLLLNNAVEMDVDQIQAGRCPPVTEQTGFDVLALQPLAQQRIVVEINLPDGQVIGRAPVGIDVLEQGRVQWCGGDSLHVVLSLMSRWGLVPAMWHHGSIEAGPIGGPRSYALYIRKHCKDCATSRKGEDALRRRSRAKGEDALRRHSRGKCVAL